MWVSNNKGEDNSMTGDSRNVLDLTLRRNRGILIRSAWVAALRKACDVEVLTEDLMSLEETEKLKKTFFEKVRQREGVVRRHWAKNVFDELASLLRNLSVDVGAMPVVLFSSVDQCIGAVRLPADRVLTHIEAIWKVVEEDLCVTTLNLQHGFCLEFNFYTETGEYRREGVYELTAWGAFLPKEFNPV
jgi:hypothetical protein